LITIIFNFHIKSISKKEKILLTKDVKEEEDKVEEDKINVKDIKKKRTNSKREAFLNLLNSLNKNN
jgi:phage pi2 protein 07